MSLLAPIIAGTGAGLAGLVTLIWMNRTRPMLERPSPPQATEADHEPSLADIWSGRVNLHRTQPQPQQPNYVYTVHPQ